jgi:glycosyltransferase involved in cell wall biosynthesis
MKRLEFSAFHKSDLIFQCSESDTEVVRKLAPACDTHVFANGVDILQFPAQPCFFQDPHPTVLFPGSFDYFPNKEAATWLKAKIWPRVLEHLPTSRLILAGRNAVSLETSANHAGSIELASDVPDMRDYFARSWLVVVPLLTGGGTRLKILEALISGRAVVSTTLGAEGVPYEKDRHLLLADDEEEFSNAIVRLLQNRDLREQLATSGREFVVSHYNWKTICDDVANLLSLKLAYTKNKTRK